MTAPVDSRLAALFTPTAAAWRMRANCRGMDPDLFYPGQGESVAEAKAVCAGCVVRAECLAYSLDAREKFGIWGGSSEKERRPMRVRRRAS